MDEEQKTEGEFVAAQTKSSARGPWSLFSNTVPFASYMRRIFYWKQVRQEAEYIAYIGKLVDSKGDNDTVVFERAQEILRDIHGVPRWLTYCRQKRSALNYWYHDVKNRSWPELRRKIGF